MAARRTLDGHPVVTMCNPTMDLFSLRKAAHRLMVRGAVVAACLWPVAQGWALSIGQARGIALIGRPLDMVIPLALDTGADSASCLEPEVFYGDSRVSPGRVSSQLDIASPTQGAVRIRSEALVDEPVVTVYLRVGCEQKITRRFVLFAERPADSIVPAAPAAQAAPAVPAQAAQAAPITRAAAAEAAAATPLAPASAASKKAAAAPAEAAAPPARASARARREPPPAKARAEARPAPKAAPRARLQLEPLDLTAERDPRLKSTQAIDVLPESSPQQRAQAAALWQALNAQPEDFLRSTQRLQALEGDLKLLRDAVTRNSTSLTEVRGELVKAREERYANPLVYGLAVALLAALALAAFLWRGARSAGTVGRDWWRGSGAARTTGYGDEPSRAGRPTDAAAPITSPSPPRPASAPAHVSAPAPVRTPAPREKTPDFRVSLEAAEKAHARTLSAGAVPRVSGRGEFADFHNSLSSGPRSVKAEELHDMQQQADFFVSLGEYERAIEVLRAHIYVNPGTSALAWLDLLGIFHQLGRRKDYEWVRGEFNRVFNAQAPAFEAYGEDAEGLEGYEQALSRIVALWPSSKVLDVLEESIFRKPGAEGGEAFSLEAYRELLLLHGIGKEVIEAGDAPVDFVTSSQPSTGFSKTSLEALSARLLGPTPVLPAGALDINLDEPPPPSSDFIQVGAPPAKPPLDEGTVDFDLPEIDYQLPKKKN